jgi:4-hydroxy-2-oxoheptanedioate aldolase
MDMYSRAAHYGCLPKKQYMQQSNEETLFILQIEGSEGLRNLGEILAVPESDVIFVGPYDLSQSLGMPGEIDHPKVVQAIEGIVATVRKSGRFVGIYADNVEAAKRWIAVGVQFIALSVDTAIYYQGCQRLVAALRQ